MKKQLFTGLATGLFLVGTVGMANATLKDMGTISLAGYEVGTFLDESTGRTWIDLDGFYGLSLAPLSNETFNSWQAKLEGTGFHIATIEEMADLAASAPAVPDLWLSHATVMGAADTPRQLIWGLFDDGTEEPAAGWEWKWSTSSTWQVTNLRFNKNSAVGSQNGWSSSSDLGIWTVSDPQPTYTCVGFESPLADGPVKVKKNRVLPSKAQLSDEGYILTDTDLIAPPVIQISYSSSIGSDVVDVSDDAYATGMGTDGNAFEYNIDDQKWQYNLKTSNYTAAGTYTINMKSGDESEYRVDSCSASFVIE